MAVRSVDSPLRSTEPLAKVSTDMTHSFRARPDREMRPDCLRYTPAGAARPQRNIEPGAGESAAPRRMRCGASPLRTLGLSRSAPRERRARLRTANRRVVDEPGSYQVGV